MTVQDEANRQSGQVQPQGDRSGMLAGIIRRWRWPARAAVFAAGAAWLFAILCPAMMERTDSASLIAAHTACMLRTFALQAGVGALLLAGLTFLLRQRKSGVICVLIGLLWLAPDAWKVLRPDTRGAVPPGAETLTVLSINVLVGRSTVEGIEREVAACNADLVLLQEFTPSLEEDLRVSLKAFPHRVQMARDDAFGQAVFSKRPFVGAPEIYPSSPRWSGEPQITVGVSFADRVVKVTNIHLLPPVGMTYVTEQRRQVNGLAAQVATPAAPLNPGVATARVERVVAGDFNGTSDTAIVQTVLRAGMIDSYAQAERGRGGTWPSEGWAAHLGKIRIDNLLHSPGLICLEAGVGGQIGSDHLPTWARYALSRE